MLNIHYFASLREKLGTANEKVHCDFAVVKTVADLQRYLVESHGESRTILSENSTRVAVNQKLADRDTAICEGDEIAFFPPVTGG